MDARLQRKIIANTIRFGILVPLAAIWSGFFWLVTKAYEGCSYVDQKGEQKIDEFNDWSESK